MIGSIYSGIGVGVGDGVSVGEGEGDGEGLGDGVGVEVTDSVASVVVASDEEADVEGADVLL